MELPCPDQTAMPVMPPVKEEPVNSLDQKDDQAGSEEKSMGNVEDNG